VGLAEPQGGQELSHGLRTHRGSAIAVEGQLIANDPLPHHHLKDQPLGKVFAFAVSQHQADDVAAEEVEDHVEVEAGPPGRPQELGDIRGPHLVGRGGQHLRLGVGGVPQLVASLAAFLMRMQDAVHRAERTEVLPWCRSAA